VKRRNSTLASRSDGHLRLHPHGFRIPTTFADTTGLRAVIKGKPGNPAQIERYLAGKFGNRLEDARQAMAELTAAYEPADLFRRGFRLYEQFRPGVPAGEPGWGGMGELDLAKVRALVL